MLEPLEKNAGRSVIADAADLHSLQARLGSADEATAVTAEELAPCLAGIHSEDDLRHFLARYQAEMIGPRELEIICRSHDHATRNEARELIALDQSIRFEDSTAPLAAASRQVGRNQLRRLRPLRDLRVIQRYDTAVHEGRANGWHTSRTTFTPRTP